MPQTPRDAATPELGERSDSWATAASRALHPSACRTTPPAIAPDDRPDDVIGEQDWIWSIASGLAGVTVPWELRDEHRPVPTERTWDLVLATPLYEVWTICWPAGTGIDLHDHGPSSGAFCLVSGELAETVADEDGATSTRIWRTGEGSQFEPGAAHAVVNHGTRMATSVHVYSPPLSAMTFYDRDGADGASSTVLAAHAAGEVTP